MLSFILVQFLLVLLLLLAGNAFGFSQFPTRVSRRSSVALEKSAASNGSTYLRATELPTRRKAIGISFCGLLTNLLGSSTTSAMTSSSQSTTGPPPTLAIAYKTISLPVDEFGVKVPVSVWYPIAGERPSDSLPPSVQYDYKISLRRIGQLLAKWEFIPEFVSRDFSLTPSGSSTIRVVDGTTIPIGSQLQREEDKASAAAKVVFLAHGFLGSRSDLGYLAEELASKGFVCVAAEYPESLEASYPKVEGLDRAAINQKLVPYVQDTMMPEQPIDSYSAIGHSLGCGTVLQMGDDSWNRVLMGSGRAPLSPSATNKQPTTTTTTSSVYKNPVVGGRLLFISSVNDGPVNNWGGGIQIPDEYTILDESKATTDTTRTLANLERAAVVFRGEGAPNHISYLSENVNDAMLAFLSPLLPVSKAMEIPVLDFDKYSDSRDSVATGNKLKPLISGFLAGTTTNNKSTTTN